MKLKKTIFLIIMLISLISIVGKVNAATTAIVDTSKKASLTITKYEHKNGSTENKALKGVEFTIYEIPKNANVNTVAQAETYIRNNNVTSYKKTTPDSGTIKFSDLNLGRYLVVETKAPKNVSTMIESFLIDLPRTNNNGTGWNYDVTVYPKNITIYGNVSLTHKNKAGDALSGMSWILQKKDKNGNWNNYEGIDALTTNNEGKISIQNLEKGEYRFVQNSVTEGYIMDKSNTVNFVVDVNHLNQNLTTKSEKLSIEKYVKSEGGEYTKNIGAFTTDTVSWKTEADVTEIISKMNTYVITEKIQEGLILNNESIKLYDQDENIIANDCYTIKIQDKAIKISFKPEKLKNVKTVILKYDTNFDYENIKSGEFNTSASLEYTDNINLEGECKGTYKTKENKANVHTGMVKIHKTNPEGTALQGAKFKIATSEENAKNDVFVKDINGNDVIAISDGSGYAIFGGLKYGEDGQSMRESKTEYWIVETEAPSEKYNLLEKPEKFLVDSNNNENILNIINKEKFNLPLTGGKLKLIPISFGIIFITLAFIIKFKNKGKQINEER